MPQQFLHGADIVAILQQMCGEAMAEGVAGDALGDACPAGGLSDSFLQTALVHVMAAHGVGTGVNGKRIGGKDVLPDPLPVSIGIFSFQGKRQVDGAISFGQVFFVQPFHTLEMLLQRHDHAIGQHRHPVFHPLAIPNDNLPLAKVNSLDAQSHTLHQPQAAAVEQFRHQLVRAR